MSRWRGKQKGCRRGSRDSVVSVLAAFAVSANFTWSGYQIRN